MDIAIPKDWCQCSKDGLETVLGWVNWVKDDFGFYCVANKGPRFAIEQDGKFWIHPEYIIE